MARPLRIEYPGACYHVTNRGNQRAVVFHDDWHYQEFLEKLGRFSAEFEVTVLSYCCMANHFHLYLKTNQSNLSRFMQGLLTSFCVTSNKKRRSSGHIFQGRFNAHLVEDECYRSRLSRYIHLNPVRTAAFRDASLIERQEHLRAFKWSSYQHYRGVRKLPKWLDCDPVLSSWGDSRRQQMKNYSIYVEEGLLKGLDNPFDDVVEQTILGSDEFIDLIKRKYLLNRTGDKNEEHALIHLQQSFSADEVINQVSSILGVSAENLIARKSGHREARRIAMYCVCRYCRTGQSFSELAKRFSVSASALTQARDKVNGELSGSLGELVKRVDDSLHKT